MKTAWRRVRVRFGAWSSAHPQLLLALKCCVWFACFKIVAEILGRLFPAQYGAVDRVWRAIRPGIFLAGGLALVAAFAVILIQELSGRRGPKPGSTLSRGDRIFLAAVIMLGGAGLCVVDFYFAAADQRTERPVR